MTENVATLITRLRDVIDTATSDSLQVEQEFCCTADEQNAASKERAEAESVRDDVVTALEAATAQRDALSAVVDNALSIGQRTGYSHHKEPVMNALEEAPAHALDRVKAEAVREAAEMAITIPDALGYKVNAVAFEDLMDRADRIEKGEVDD